MEGQLTLAVSSMDLTSSCKRRLDATSIKLSLSSPQLFLFLVVYILFLTCNPITNPWKSFVVSLSDTSKIHENRKIRKWRGLSKPFYFSHLAKSKLRRNKFCSINAMTLYFQITSFSVIASLLTRLRCLSIQALCLW